MSGTNGSSSGASGAGDRARLNQHASSLAGRSARGNIGRGLVGGAVGAASGNGAQAGMLGQAEALMSVAILEATAASMLPPALWIAFQFKLASSKPQNIIKAAYAFNNAADSLDQASNELKEMVRSFPQQAWSTEDRDKFELYVQQYAEQLDALKDYFMSVSGALTALAWALYSYALGAAAVGTVLASLALLSVGPQYAACVAVAGTCLTYTSVATGILAFAGAMAAMTLSMMASYSAEMQKMHGNQFADAALHKAFAEGAKTGGVNLAQNGINGALAYLNRGDAPVGKVFGKNGELVNLPDRFFKEVDLDADRDKDGTWNVGGGAKFVAGGHEIEAGTHHKWDSKGNYQGGDAEVKDKWDLGGGHNVAGGLKTEWQPDGGIMPDAIGLNGGYENSQTGQKVGGEGAYKGDDGWEFKGTGSNNYGAYEGSHKTQQEATVDETPPWDR